MEAASRGRRGPSGGGLGQADRYAISLFRHSDHSGMLLSGLELLKFLDAEVCRELLGF